jgi:hypothetical protein
VAKADIRRAAKEVGLAEGFGWERYIELCEKFPDALTAAEEELTRQGFSEASQLADFIRKDSAPRLGL